MAAMMFSHVALSCRDPLATERFYCKYLGFARARVIPLGEGADADQVVFLKSGSVYLELFRAEGDSLLGVQTADGPHTVGVRHIAFQVDDVDATLAAMGEGARVTLGPLDFSGFIPNWKTVWVSDPDGNIVEISQGFVDQQNPPALD